jgi:hypothetical protein
VLLSLSACAPAATKKAEESAPSAASVSAPAEQVRSVPEVEEEENSLPANEEASAQSSSEAAEKELAAAGEESQGDGITPAEYDSFGVTVEDAKENAVGFRDFEETMHSSFLGTWYDPEMGEALRITEEGAYVYIPYLELYGDTLYSWELVDRTEEGKCPKLSIRCFGEDGPGLAYYVGGNTGEYFWCVSQEQLFYRQD